MVRRALHGIIGMRIHATSRRYESVIRRSAVAVRDSKSHRAFGRDVATIATRSVLVRHIDLAESILYLCALIAHQPRAIDRYIHYFGETPSAGSVAP